MDETMAKYKFTIEIDEEMLQLMLEALEFYERVVGLGQIEEVGYAYRLKKKLTTSWTEHNERMKIADLALDTFKMAVVGMPRNQSHGIYSPEVNDNIKKMYDMYKTLRKSLAESRLREAIEAGNTETANHLRMTVDMQGFSGVYFSEPPVHVSFVPMAQESQAEPEEVNDATPEEVEP
jgi:hypothetical protein